MLASSVTLLKSGNISPKETNSGSEPKWFYFGSFEITLLYSKLSSTIENLLYAKSNIADEIFLILFALLPPFLLFKISSVPLNCFIDPTLKM